MFWGRTLRQALDGFNSTTIAKVSAEKHRQMEKQRVTGGLAINVPLKDALRDWKHRAQTILRGVRSPKARAVWVVTAASSRTVELYGGLWPTVDCALVSCQKESPAWWAALAGSLPNGTKMIDDQEQILKVAKEAGFVPYLPADFRKALAA